MVVKAIVWRIRGGIVSGPIVSIVHVGTEADGGEGRVTTINDRTAQAGLRNRASTELVCPSHHRQEIGEAAR
jgi:hypothetical protein